MVLALVVGFGLGRLSGRDAGLAEIRSPDSFRATLEERDPLLRAYRLGVLMEALGPDELPALQAELEADSKGFTPEAMRLLMLAWTRFDADGALAWARARPESRRRDALMEAAMYAWGFRNGRDALQALEALEANAEPEAKLRAALVEGWVQSEDRLRASAYVATIEEPRRRSRLGFLLAGEAARDGPDAVIEWAEAVPADAPNEFKQIAFYHAVGVVAREDPQRAAAWLEANWTQPFRGRALDELARKWAQHHDPPQFFGWIEQFQAAQGRADGLEDGIATAFRIWYTRAPEEAEAWLRSALPDPALDPAIRELVRKLAQSAPGEAVAWAAQLQDETERRASTFRAARLWLRDDPEAAQAWLAASDLPEAQRQAILRGPQPSGAQRAVVLPRQANP